MYITVKHSTKGRANIVPFTIFSKLYLFCANFIQKLYVYLLPYILPLVLVETSSFAQNTENKLFNYCKLIDWGRLNVT